MSLILSKIENLHLNGDQKRLGTCSQMLNLRNEK